MRGVPPAAAPPAVCPAALPAAAALAGGACPCQGCWTNLLPHAQHTARTAQLLPPASAKPSTTAPPWQRVQGAHILCIGRWPGTGSLRAIPGGPTSSPAGFVCRKWPPAVYCNDRAGAQMHTVYRLESSVRAINAHPALQISSDARVRRAAVPSSANAHPALQVSSDARVRRAAVPNSASCYGSLCQKAIRFWSRRR